MECPWSLTVLGGQDRVVAQGTGDVLGKGFGLRRNLARFPGTEDIFLLHGQEPFDPFIEHDPHPGDLMQGSSLLVQGLFEREEFFLIRIGDVFLM